MDEVKNEVSKLMVSVRKKKKLPSSARIVDETFEQFGYIQGCVKPEVVQQGFNDILRKVWIETLSVLEAYEEQVYPSNVMEALMSLKADLIVKAGKVAQEKGFRIGVRFLFVALYPYLREIFLSIGQGRKTRGGRDFELQFGKLLDLMEVPYQKIKRSYRVDFMLPSDEVFKQNPTAAAILSAKRTLRERWREVVEELHAMRCPNIFLVTADDKVGKGHVEEICRKYLIHLVVWDSVKERYGNEPLVLGYGEWASKRLPLLQKFWEEK